MKKTILIVLFLNTYALLQAQTKVEYVCPMHAQIVRSKPGKCPICGMTLVKKNTPSATKKVMPRSEDSLHNNNSQKAGSTDSIQAQHNMDMKDEMQGSASNSIDVYPQIQNEVDVSPGKTVRYHLYVKDTMVNYTGKMKMAIAINGSIPGPALVFTEGDTAEIYLHNGLMEETSLHWHGVVLPNPADGVPLLTTAQVMPDETHLYKFRVVQNGTYWYHSHSGLQEQSGMYGALLFEPKENQPHPDSVASLSSKKGFDTTLTIVLSEWTNEHPMQVQRLLRTANDWFAIKKRSTQSYAEAIKDGYFKTKLTNEWKRMRAMDVSDVYYDRFLLNGKKESSVPGLTAGQKIKLKIVNAGASSYFWLGYSGGKITVIANDGNDMVPVAVDRLIIAPAETYDLIVTVPAGMSYEFRATAEDRTGYSSLWLGTGMKMPAPTLPRLKYFEGMKMMNDMMNLDGSMNHMGMKMSNQVMDMNSVMYPELIENSDTSEKSTDTMNNMPGMNMGAGGRKVTLNYNMLRSPVKTILPDGPAKVLHFTLTGNMNRYLWTLDNKTVKEADRILIRKGETVKLIITNNSMMRHPMHLHGHDFRVLNKQGEFAPLKNVIDIMPMETDSVEFAANQDGNWFFHCHILFHMMAGMGRVFTYVNSPVNPELPDAEKAYRMFRKHKDQNMQHLAVRAGLESNGSDGEAMLLTNRYALKEVWHLGLMPDHGYESETILGRYLGANQWWFPYIGFDYHYKKVNGDIVKTADYRNLFTQVSNKTHRKTFVAGIEYTLPWLVLADARVDGNGKFRFQLSREDIPVTKRLRFSFMGNTDKEYMAGFRYIVSKWFAFSTHYDSDMGFGVGVTLTY